ncbi:MAG: site-specific integrase [Verrucomicrobiae bacterium]|nr:site-specific integrase [Verrucomicrobiae bacterium]
MPKQTPTEARTRRGNRIYRNQFQVQGDTRYSDDFLFAVKKEGERHRLNLGGELEKAKKLADQISAFLMVPSHSFSDLFEHPDFQQLKKPRAYQRRLRASYRAEPNDLVGAKHAPLVGEVVRRYESNAVHLSKTTVSEAVNALRHLAAAISGLSLMRRNSTKRQRDQWRKKTDAVPLNELTLSALEEYRTATLRKVGEDQLDRGRRITTLNSYFRCARSVFSERMMAFYGDFDLPDPLPLRQVRPMREPSRRYVSKINVADIMAKAKKRFWLRELSDEDKADLPPTNRSEDDLVREDKARFIILLLTIACGLRPKEVSRLTWEQVDLQRRQIHVAVTSYDTPKARSSECSVDVTHTVMAYLEEFQPYSIFPPFVIPAPRYGDKEPAKPGQIFFRQLYLWLRKQGVGSQNPLYIFRKEAGSIIYDQTDSYDLAADFLRNDPRIAREHYVGRRKRLEIEVPGLES